MLENSIYTWMQRLFLNDESSYGKRVNDYTAPNRATHWDGRNAFGGTVASDVYSYTLTAGGFTTTRKMVIKNGKDTFYFHNSHHFDIEHRHDRLRRG